MDGLGPSRARVYIHYCVFVSSPSAGRQSQGSRPIPHFSSVLFCKQFLISSLLNRCNSYRNMSVWSDLTAIGDRRGAKSSAFALMEHAEKLRSSLALRALHTPGSTLIDTAIRRVLQERAVELTNDKLTQQDLFYRHISALGDFFPCFVDVVCETVAGLSGSPSEKVKPITNAANFIIAMTNAARDYRARNIEQLDQCENSFEILPWIAVSSN